MSKSLPTCGIPEDFQLTEKTVARVLRDHPMLDVEKTLEKFILNAEAKGWMYRNWQSAFVNYVDNGAQYGGVFYKTGRAADPRWLPILAEAKPYGFRDPYPHDTPATYRTDFEMWKRAEKRSVPVIDFSSALKAIK